MSIEKQIWDHLIAQGMTPHGAAGLMGNLYAESGLKPNNLENLCEKRLKEHGKPYTTDETYTAAVDSGKISRSEFLNPLPGKQYGYGLAQWTSPGRKAGLYDLVKSRGVSIADAPAQLDFLIRELNTSYKSVLKVLKTAKAVKEASDVVLVKYEAPANCGASVRMTRAKYGQKYYDKYVKGATMSCTPDKVITIAKAEDGYLEKRSNSQLDSKTANAGSSNYTKYWRDLVNWGLGNYQAQYWCAGFVHWCFVKAFGLAAAKKLLLHAPYISCDALAAKSKAAGRRYTTPAVGDVVVFWNGSRYSHTGIVYQVSGGYFYTIEGNTSGASGVISNGGGVVAGKKYKIAGTSHRFHRPAYDSTPATGNTATKNATIAAGQIHANNFCGSDLAIDGERGEKTKEAGIMVLQTAMNLDYNAGLEIDGIWGPKSDTALKGHYVKRGESQHMVTALEILFMLRGIECGGVESPGVFGEGLENAVNDFEGKKGWRVDGTAEYGTFISLAGVKSV